MQQELLSEIIWDRKKVQDLINNNDQAALKALIKIYQQQTPLEQNNQSTSVSNDVGFTAFDAEILSIMARVYLDKGRLTPKQLDLVKRRMQKYWRQILLFIEAKGHKVSFSRKKAK